MCSTMGGGGGVQYHRDIMIHVGRYLEYRGDVQYRGGYLEYCGRCLVPWGISWCMWWDIISAVGGVQYWGQEIFCYVSTPWYWTPPRYLWYPPMVLKLQRIVSSHSTEHPMVLNIAPTCIMISLIVLSIPMALKITPHGTYDSPPWYWTPPSVLKISLMVLNIPRYSRYPPHASWYHPWHWTLPPVLHTCYTRDWSCNEVRLEYQSQSQEKQTCEMALDG